MKKILFSALLLAGITFTGFVADDTENYTARTDKTSLKWTGTKVGGEHSGTVKLKSGSFSVKDELITSGSFVIDMKSIDVTDSESKKLYNHIRGVDFFNVEAHPESKLVITGSKKSGDDIEVSGNMTILEKTNPITFKATLSGKTENFRIYNATITIDRTKYGIVYKSSAVGDAFIDDNFTIQVKLAGEKQAG